MFNTTFSHSMNLQLFLLHLDSMILEANSGKQSGNGCSTVLCNNDDVSITIELLGPKEMTVLFQDFAGTYRRRLSCR